MLNYEGIKALASQLGRPVTSLLSLTPANDPFSVGRDNRRQTAEWFATLWNEHKFPAGVHVRRIHYVLVSRGGQVLKRNGKPYLNTENDWKLLTRASRDARYLGLIDADALTDRRNDEVQMYAYEGPTDRQAICSVEETAHTPAYYALPDEMEPPFCSLWGFNSPQEFIVEVWTEKPTQND